MRPSHFTSATAQRSCRRRLAEQYHLRRSAFRNIRVVRGRGDHFRVSGEVTRYTRTADVFECRVVHGEVVSLRLHPRNKRAAAIGKVVLGAAIVGAAVAQARGDADLRRYPDYRGGNPFRNRTYLKNACRHEIARQLRHSHSDFTRLRFLTALKRNRSLQGDGRVRWNGTSHRFHYTCQFSRRGRVVDGLLHYYPERARFLGLGSLFTSNQDRTPVEQSAWKVVDVADNDVLYVHSQALLASPRIGSLPPNATGVKVYGCAWSDVDKGTWCEVEYQGLRGFAAQIYLSRDS